MDATSVTARRLLPVVVLDQPGQANPLADALVAGGLPVAEVTFRTDAAADAIARLASRVDVMVGAGTVLSAKQVDVAVDNGAGFIVSPGLSRAVAERCRARNVPYIPGAVTASEVQAALELGLTTLKFFPAATSGGPAAITALSAPFADVSFVPTGGVDPSNLRDYLDVPAVAAIGGSWMVSRDLVAAGDADAITRLTAEAVAMVNT